MHRLDRYTIECLFKKKLEKDGNKVDTVLGNSMTGCIEYYCTDKNGGDVKYQLTPERLLEAYNIIKNKGGMK